MKNSRFLIGTDLFSKYRLQGGYFVDKSLFIADVINGDDVVLIPRPRRFGKTLNLTMLKAFFEIDEPKNRNLFRGLKIEQDCENHHGIRPIRLGKTLIQSWGSQGGLLREFPRSLGSEAPRCKKIK